MLEGFREVDVRVASDCCNDYQATVNTKEVPSQARVSCSCHLNPSFWTHVVVMSEFESFLFAGITLL